MWDVGLVDGLVVIGTTPHCIIDPGRRVVRVNGT
jgi:hypothetical protein